MFPVLATIAAAGLYGTVLLWAPPRLAAIVTVVLLAAVLVVVPSVIAP